LVSTFKVSPERFRHLAQLIQTATKTQDWLGIKRYDLQLRDLLETHQAYLSDPRLAPAINEARLAHQQAARLLNEAISEMESDINMMDSQHERAQAYQLAMRVDI
jgi:hypothetical protein